jgi:hypothetical protein
VNALQRVGRRARNFLAGCDVTGKRDHRNVRVANQRRAGGLAVSIDDVEHALREVLGGDSCQVRGRDRCLLRRLEHDRVACSKRGPYLPDGHHQRIVPGRHLTDDAYRLAPQHRGIATHVLTRRAPFETARRAGEEAQVVDHERNFLAHRLDRLADVQ